MGLLGGLAADAYDRQYDDKYLIRRLASYFIPHKRRVLTIALLLVLFALIASGTPILISAGVEALQASDSGLTIPAVVAGLLAIAVVNFGAYLLRRRLTVRVVNDVISQLRKDAFSAAVERDLAFYDDNKSGKIVSRITSDTQELSQVIVIVADLVEQLTEFVIVFLVLLNREWRLTLLLLGMSEEDVVQIVNYFKYVSELVEKDHGDDWV